MKKQLQLVIKVCMFLGNNTSHPPVGQSCLQSLVILWIPHVFKSFDLYWVLSLLVYMVKYYSYLKTSHQHQFFLKNIDELYYYIYRLSILFLYVNIVPYVYNYLVTLISLCIYKSCFLEGSDHLLFIF